MITISKAAAAQIQLSAQQNESHNMSLRIACQRNADGSFHYAIGFTDDEQDQDLHFTSEGINIIVAPTSFNLVDTMEIDYVELDVGGSDFIFKNPNDPQYAPGSD